MSGPSRNLRERRQQRQPDATAIGNKEYLVGYVEDFETPAMIEKKFAEMDSILNQPEQLLGEERRPGRPQALAREYLELPSACAAHLMKTTRRK